MTSKNPLRIPLTRVALVKRYNIMRCNGHVSLDAERAQRARIACIWLNYIMTRVQILRIDYFARDKHLNTKNRKDFNRHT